MITELLESDLARIALRILIAFLVFIAGRWLANRSRGLLTKSLRKSELPESIITLVTTLSFYGIWIFAGLLALGILGVPPTTLVTALGIVVVILAIALQTSLGNLAATVIILLFKPFKIGDVIETAGKVGIVHEIQMFDTVLLAPDGKTHFLPNGLIQGGGLTNYSTTGRLRLNLSFTIDYESDFDQAKQILAALLAADDRVLPEPAPQVFVQDLGDNGIELVAWPFVNAADFAVVQAEIIEQVRKTFAEAGIVIPKPQLDVHLYSQS
jgi:small conductance mechanosensitive channel